MTVSESGLPIGHELVEGQPHHAVTIYGHEWCEDTARCRELMDRLGVPYNYYNVDLDPAIAKTAWALENGGQKTPVVRLGEDRVLVEPSDDELIAALRETGRLH